jgi:hypothetical protein
LKGVRQNTDKGRCPLCLDEEDVKHILLVCRDTRIWRLKLLNDMWLSINKVVACKKILRCKNKDQLRNLGKYLDIVKCRRFNKNNCKYEYKMREDYYHGNLVLIGKQPQEM